jgi:hypothetical protein
MRRSGFIRRDLVGIAEGRPQPVLEADAINPHRDGDTAGEGGVVLADHGHREHPLAGEERKPRADHNPANASQKCRSILQCPRERKKRACRASNRCDVVLRGHLLALPKGEP